MGHLRRKSGNTKPAWRLQFDAAARRDGLSKTVHRQVYPLIDASRSMSGQSKIEEARNGAVRFAQTAFGQRYSVGLIQFNTQATILMPPGTTFDAIRVALGKIQPGGSTNMAAAIGLGA